MNAMEEVATALAAELRQPRLEWQASFMRAARRLYEGELDRAERTAEQTLELGRRAGQDGEAFIFYNEQILEIRRWQAPPRRARSRPGPARGQRRLRLRLRAHALRVRRRRGRRRPDGVHGEDPAARAPTAAGHAGAGDDVQRGLPRRPLRRRRARASVVYRALEPYASAFTSTTVAKPVGAHHLGMLASMLGEAELAARALPRRDRRARTRRRAAAPGRDPPRARAVPRRFRSAAGRLPTAPRLRACHRRAARAGLPPPRLRRRRGRARPK